MEKRQIEIIYADETHTKFSCGCEFETVGENFLIKPCSLKCCVYKYIIEQSKKKGNIISYYVEKDMR